MRLKVTLKTPFESNGAEVSEFEGVLVLRDESFLMVKMKNNILRCTHFDNIDTIHRVNKGSLYPVGLENFRKIRE